MAVRYTILEASGRWGGKILTEQVEGVAESPFVIETGTMYQAGILSGNPLAMAARLATLHSLLQDDVFSHIEQMTTMLTRSLREASMVVRLPLQANCLGAMFGFYSGVKLVATIKVVAIVVFANADRSLFTLVASAH